MVQKKRGRWFDDVPPKRDLEMLVQNIHHGLAKINFGWSVGDNHAIEVGLTIAREAKVELEALDNNLKRMLCHLGKMIGPSIDELDEDEYYDDDDVEEDEKEYECPYRIEPQQCERNSEGKPIMPDTNSVPMDCSACVYINYARR